MEYDGSSPGELGAGKCRRRRARRERGRVHDAWRIRDASGDRADTHRCAADTHAQAAKHLVGPAAIVESRARASRNAETRACANRDA